jgi:hypothetical protein
MFVYAAHCREKKTGSDVTILCASDDSTIKMNLQWNNVNVTESKTKSAY